MVSTTAIVIGGTAVVVILFLIIANPEIGEKREPIVKVIYSDIKPKKFLDDFATIKVNQTAIITVRIENISEEEIEEIDDAEMRASLVNSDNGEVFLIKQEVVPMGILSHKTAESAFRTIEILGVSAPAVEFKDIIKVEIFADEFKNTELTFVIVMEQ